MEEKRSTFSGKLGFVLAAAGSAVGLGNIWRFPYLAAKYGGGIFLLVYLILVVTFGYALMITETAIGRKTGLSPIGAFRKLSKKFTFVGVIAAFVAFLILPYYSVIGGWVLKYLTMYITGGHAAVADGAFFGNYISKPVEPIVWHSIFLLATFIVVVRGIKGGIEKASRIMMPVLVVLAIIIAAYSVTRPGAMEGIKFYLLPNFADFSSQTVLAALGQMFYSMSLAMGIMITYGSYLRKEDDLEQCVSRIEIFDTGIAILAGLMVIPAVFAFSGGKADAVNAGPGLMFQTIPKVFEAMGLSTVIGVLFFALVLFAALTSSISLMEAVVSVICDQWKVSRTKSCVIALILAVVLGIPSSLGFGVWSKISITTASGASMSILDMMDFITNSVLMPITALITSIVVGYVIKPAVISEEVRLSSPFKREWLFLVMTKYIAPICIVAILVSSVLNAFGLITL
ncbi:MAG: sodium-dependent transporter [Ruminococcaceae bacterium]|nr:sodium-dependent transporter [Oscillospiraceae bacterium]